MTNKTATQAAYEEFQVSRGARVYADFRERWGPCSDDVGLNQDFDADLYRLLAEVREEALRPFIDAAAHQMASRPVPAVMLKTRGHTQEQS